MSVLPKSVASSTTGTCVERTRKGGSSPHRPGCGPGPGPHSVMGGPPYGLLSLILTFRNSGKKIDSEQETPWLLKKERTHRNLEVLTPLTLSWKFTSCWFLNQYLRKMTDNCWVPKTWHIHIKSWLTAYQGAWLSHFSGEGTYVQVYRAHTWQERNWNCLSVSKAPTSQLRAAHH